MDWVFTQAEIDAWDRCIFGEKKPEIVEEPVVETPAHIPKKRGIVRKKKVVDKDPLSRYKRLKIQILREMCITTTADEEARLLAQESMEKVDQYTRSLIMSKL